MHFRSSASLAGSAADYTGQGDNSMEPQFRSDLGVNLDGPRRIGPAHVGVVGSIRIQAGPGPITCRVCGQDFNRRTPCLGNQPQLDGRPACRGSSGGVEADPSLVGQDGDPLGA